MNRLLYFSCNPLCTKSSDGRYRDRYRRYRRELRRRLVKQCSSRRTAPTCQSLEPPGCRLWRFSQSLSLDRHRYSADCSRRLHSVHATLENREKNNTQTPRVLRQEVLRSRELVGSFVGYARCDFSKSN